MTTAAGDTVFLQDYLINTRVYGVVTPAGAPPEFWATYEIQGDQGTLMMAAVLGPTGPAGANAFAMTLQTDPYDSPDELPNTLTNTVADIGKYWAFDDVDASGNVIGSSLWVWYGTSYRRLMLGSPGPPGPVPIITPSLSLIPNGQNSTIDVGGTPLYPDWHLFLESVPGPTGPAAALALCPDVDLVTTPPVAGDLLGTTGRTTTVHINSPSSLIVVTHGTGGSLPAGVTYWGVTATTSLGETVVSNLVSATLTGSTSSAVLSWVASAGGTGYKVYRGTSTALTTLVTTLGNATSYTDTGTAGTAASPPSSNTAGVSYPVWVPVSVSQLVPGPYSVPENAFTSFSGISARAAIGSFAIPPQPFPWTPVVWGHFGAFGVELSADPLMIGAEVRLGDPTSGQQIGRGFGNAIGEVHVMPHYSNPNNASVAITPTNGVAVVPANHSSAAQGTIYFNLYNDGAIGLYQFSPTDAQMMVMVMPVSPGGTTGAAILPTPVPPITVLQHCNNLWGYFPQSITAWNAVVVVVGGVAAGTLPVTVHAPTFGGSTPTGSFAVWNNGGTNCLQSPSDALGIQYFISVWVLPDNALNNGTTVSVTNATAFGWDAYEVSGLGNTPVAHTQNHGSGPSDMTYNSGSIFAPDRVNALVIAEAYSGGGFSSVPEGWVANTEINRIAGYQIQDVPGAPYAWSGGLAARGAWVSGVVAITET